MARKTSKTPRYMATAMLPVSFWRSCDLGDAVRADQTVQKSGNVVDFLSCVNNNMRMENQQRISRFMFFLIGVSSCTQILRCN